MAASALLKQIPYLLRSGWLQLLSSNKETLFSEKKMFPAIKHSNLQRKDFFFWGQLLRITVLFYELPFH